MSSSAPLYKNPDFDQFAEDYDAALAKGISVSGENKDYFAEGRVKWLAKCLARRNFVPRNILDFGCGTGSAAPYLKGLLGFERLLGLEVSAKSIQVAEKLHGAANIHFQLSSEYVPTAEMSLAFCNGVFHHIPPAERIGALRYILAALQPGGLFSLWENNPWNPGTRLVMSRIPFDRDAIPLSFLETKRLLRHAGFEICSVDFLFYFPRALKFLRPLERLGRKIPLGAQYQVLTRKPIKTG
jgi:SAM-dependent methyltransferase